jgi:hypothetical protein
MVVLSRMRFSGALAVLMCIASVSCERKASQSAPPARLPATSSPSVQTATAGAPATPLVLEEVDEREGPFTSGTQTFTVVLHSKRLPGRTDPDGQTLAWLEMRDAGGATAYREEFAHSIENGAFVESCAAHAEPLAGNSGRGVLVTVDCLPSAPLSGGRWSVFGVVGGRLKRFGAPLVADGALGPFKPGAVSRSGSVTQTLADMLTLRLWTGYFFVSVPIRVDWQQGALAPGQRCLEQTGRGFAEGGCEWPAEDAQPARRNEQTFVRLFRESSEASGPVAHVVVNPSSKVEVVAGKARVIWNEGPEATSLAADDDIWVRVRIDGREGWLHGDEDLQAAGLFRAG